jgi:Family of unknown function (DUF5871)
MAFTQPKKTSDGRYYVKPLERVLVQLNNVTFVTEYTESENLTIQIDETAQAIIGAIDVQNLQAAKTHCEVWFKRVVADKTIEAAYTKSFTDGTMNVTKPVYSKVYCNKEVITGENISGGDVVLEFSGMWFAKKTFGPVWKIIQTRVKAPPKKKFHDDYLFQEDDETVSDEEFV